MALLRYTVIVVEETGEHYPLSCRLPSPAEKFFMTVLRLHDPSCVEGRRQAKQGLKGRKEPPS
jgi:hypothetical protein